MNQQGYNQGQGTPQQGVWYPPYPTGYGAPAQTGAQPSSGVPTYGAQPTYGGQPAYGGQTVAGGQPTYGGQTVAGGQPTYGGQAVAGGQPTYGGQVVAGGQPTYGGQVVAGGQPTYGGQSPYGAQGVPIYGDPSQTGVPASAAQPAAQPAKTKRGDQKRRSSSGNGGGSGDGDHGRKRSSEKGSRNTRKSAKNGGSSGGNGGTSKPKRRKSLKWQLFKVLLVLILLAAAGAGAYVLKVQSDTRPYVSVFLPNISVDGIDLSGMTWEQGSAAVWAQVNEKQNGWYVRLKSPAGEYNDITAATLGIAFDPTTALSQAWAIGHDGGADGRLSVFELNSAVQAASTRQYEFSSAQQSADTTVIDTILRTLEQAANRSAQNAMLLSFNPDDLSRPFTFQSEVYGQYLDTSAIREEILDMVQHLRSGEITLTPTVVAPEITVSDLQKQVELRYRATTQISTTSTEERTNNIRTACAKINGYQLDSGKKFSFNSVVGNRTLDNGFGYAIEYAYGTERMGIGGGVCQVSTTLYLAATQGGLTITSRTAHSNPVNYTDLGLDATVNDTRGHEVDLVLRNDTASTIYFSAHVMQSGSSSKRLVCDIRIYGASLDGVTYVLQGEVVETLPKPAEPTYVEDEDMEHVTFTDEQAVRTKGREGYVVDTYLTTFQNGAQTARDFVSRDTYPARADSFWVGVTQRYNYD